MNKPKIDLDEANLKLDILQIISYEDQVKICKELGIDREKESLWSLACRLVEMKYMIIK